MKIFKQLGSISILSLLFTLISAGSVFANPVIAEPIQNVKPTHDTPKLSPALQYLALAIIITLIISVVLTLIFLAAKQDKLFNANKIITENLTYYSIAALGLIAMTLLFELFPIIMIMYIILLVVSFIFRIYVKKKSLSYALLILYAVSIGLAYYTITFVI
ncbi:MAG: hypothetical protein K6G26_00940 [Lachnospiraceae bacterium]|nr:hypothetical protein [Lachnospiraceae bacterium]